MNKKQEKQKLLEKMYMLIGVFFHEIGSDLIKQLTACTEKFDQIAGRLKITAAWNEKNFSEVRKYFNAYTYELNISIENFDLFKTFLIDRMNAILGLLGNPNLIEHDNFTDMLWAVFHFADELHHRQSFGGLPPADIEHLKGDAVRAFQFLTVEWLAYMCHLKTDYPYLFSIAVRTNPFDREAIINVMK